MKSYARPRTSNSLERQGQRKMDMMDLLEIGWEGVELIHLVQDRDQWRALVNTIMILRVPYKVGNFLTA